MLMAEFANCVKYQLPIKIVIFRNNSLGMIKWDAEARPFQEPPPCNGSATRRSDWAPALHPPPIGGANSPPIQ